jgi:hypothetical protein
VWQAGKEDWNTELLVIQVTVVRSITIRVATFAFFIISLQAKLHEFACWETFIGIESYKYVTFVACGTCAQLAVTYEHWTKLQVLGYACATASATASRANTGGIRL